MTSKQWTWVGLGVGGFVLLQQRQAAARPRINPATGLPVPTVADQLRAGLQQLGAAVTGARPTAAQLAQSASRAGLSPSAATGRTTVIPGTGIPVVRGTGPQLTPPPTRPTGIAGTIAGIGAALSRVFTGGTAGSRTPPIVPPGPTTRPPATAQGGLPQAGSRSTSPVSLGSGAGGPAQPGAVPRPSATAPGGGGLGSGTVPGAGLAGLDAADLIALGFAPALGEGPGVVAGGGLASIIDWGTYDDPTSWGWSVPTVEQQAPYDTGYYGEASTFDPFAGFAPSGFDAPAPEQQYFGEATDFDPFAGFGPGESASPEPTADDYLWSTQPYYGEATDFDPFAGFEPAVVPYYGEATDFDPFAGFDVWGTEPVAAGDGYYGEATDFDPFAGFSFDSAVQEPYYGDTSYQSAPLWDQASMGEGAPGAGDWYDTGWESPDYSSPYYGEASDFDPFAGF